MAILLEKVRKVAGSSSEKQMATLEFLKFLAFELGETNARITVLVDESKDRITSLDNIPTEELRKELRKRLELAEKEEIGGEPTNCVTCRHWSDGAHHYGHCSIGECEESRRQCRIREKYRQLRYV